MRFLILHGTSSNSKGNWFLWLKAELEALGHQVVVPDLPGADQPDVDRYYEHLKSLKIDFNDLVVIGHSSGSVALLGIIQNLKDERLHSAIMVGSFTKRLSESPSWTMLSRLFNKPFDYEQIKKKVGKFIFVHSIDDPICDINEAKELHAKLGGEFIELQGKGHMILRLDPSMDKFPELLDTIKQKVL